MGAKDFDIRDGTGREAPPNRVVKMARDVEVMGALRAPSSCARR